MPWHIFLMRKIAIAELDRLSAVIVKSPSEIFKWKFAFSFLSMAVQLSIYLVTSGVDPE